MSIIEPQVFEFLTLLRRNNNREWFNANKELYEKAYENVAAFAATLIGEMNKVDRLEPLPIHRSLYRIYRDLRFSKDKTPYKIFFGGRLRRATRWQRGGYYFRIEPGNSVLSAGFINPDSADLKRIREAIAIEPEKLRSILQDQEFSKIWGSTFVGDAVLTAPRGFDADHPAIDLIRFKQFRLVHRMDDELVLSEDFVFHVVKAYLLLRPFLDYMSKVLTNHLKENG